MAKGGGGWSRTAGFTCRNQDTLVGSVLIEGITTTIYALDLAFEHAPCQLCGLLVVRPPLMYGDTFGH
ncbi:hypothetical protein NDU88_000859 [Pleurodeles waltl]|uniref:Uncharacterized protein n=1 Tax=Pleurodeles waltl TaxID=8319 RepID=A0AAV7UUJ7_PLEWA|nr:hypothetical protein NDU88_000859 [Pleurodeles waltl]